jgi:DNA-binding CsgD family transcriptional regulator
VIGEPELPYLNLVVLDRHLTVIGAEQGALKVFADRLRIEGSRLEALRKAFERLAVRPPHDRRTVMRLGSSLLHLVWLGGPDGPYYAIFVERQIETEELEKAAKRYGLTRRETEVLSLMISGKNGNEIAKALCICLTTVNDHFKSLRRKTGSHTRSTMLIKILGKEPSRSKSRLGVHHLTRGAIRS